jgi:hypothetical protein
MCIATICSRRPYVAYKQPVRILIWKCGNKFSQLYTVMKSVNYVSLLETFEETEKGIDFTQRKARSEFASGCFGGDATLQQVTLKVICLVHSHSLWQNCSSFKCLYNISYTLADFSASSRTSWELLHFVWFKLSWVADLYGLWVRIFIFKVLSDISTDLLLPVQWNLGSRI